MTKYKLEYSDSGYEILELIWRGKDRLNEIKRETGRRLKQLAQLEREENAHLCD